MSADTPSPTLPSPTPPSPATWGATHVLAYEKDGKMVEVIVRREACALYTAEEWAGHAVPDWTFEEDGRLCYCGEDYASTMGTCTLRPFGKPRLKMDAVLMAIDKGLDNAWDVAIVLQRSCEEVETSIATLVRLGKLEVREDGAVRLAKEPESE